MIEVRNLSFQYGRKEGFALQSLNFSIPKGEIFGFLGPSGSGKSTTQKIITRLLDGYKGEVWLAGKELSKWDQQLYHKIGVGFELPNHYLKLTARENLALFASLFGGAKRNPMRLMERLGIAESADKRVETFSKGMQMRLNLVRALQHDPEMLFLDEPTSGLDPGNARLIKDLILELREEGKTIFLCTHYMPDAKELCDRVAFIVKGKIVLIENPGVLSRIYGQPIVRIETEGSSTTFEFPLARLGQNPAFLKILQQPIRTIHSDEASLEDIFIRLTQQKR